VRGIAHNFLEYSAKFREFLIKIGAKFDEKVEKYRFFAEFWTASVFSPFPFNRVRGKKRRKKEEK